jgi:uncharacterized protein (TIGR00661 family)
MRILFTVQGEGRGHLTQALAVHERLLRWGHELVGLVVGRDPQGGGRELPAYFTEAFPVPVTPLPSPSFAIRGHRSVDPLATVSRAFRHLGTWRRSVATLRALVQERRPDLIVNFFEPLVGLAQWFGHLAAPVLAVGHQFLLRDRSYGRLRGHAAERWGMRRFVDLVGHGSWQLALALTPVEDRPRERWFASPPLLRESLFSLAPAPGDYILVYVLNHGYLEEVAAWHARHRDVPLRCFSDRPGAPDVEEVAPNLTYHRLDGDVFLRMMAGCRAVATTAGFESASEAAWLGKPSLVVPVRGHVEQRMNAVDTVRAGLGRTAESFDLDLLLEPTPAPERYASFREWVACGDAILERVMQEAAGGGR